MRHERQDYSKTSGNLRRYAESVVLVAVWMSLGWFFHPSGPAYLLIGIPLVIIFQVFVVRRPLQQLWVRHADSFQFDWRLLAAAVALMLIPAWAFFSQIRLYGIFILLIALGAIPCAFALRHQSTAKLLSALPSFVIATLVGGIAMWNLYGHDAGFALNKLPALLSDTVSLTLVGFVVEEVAFRGAIDSHVFSSESTRSEQWLSAIFVSLMWFLWHLPLKYFYPSYDLSHLARALFINIAWGAPLSFCWRKSGTLVLPSFVHALCDAYRNVLMM